jgi:hypothetical protein
MLLDHLDVTATEICADVRDERVWGLIFPGIANIRQKTTQSSDRGSKH